MMGHRDELKGGEEWDLVGWRKTMSKGHRWRWVKNKINRRARKAGKKEVKSYEPKQD